MQIVSTLRALVRERRALLLIGLAAHSVTAWPSPVWAQSQGTSTIAIEARATRRIAAESAGAIRFASVAAVRIASDGRVAILDPLDRRVVLFAPGGEVLAALAATGQGPREVASVADLCGDPSREMRVLDPVGSRIAAVTAAGQIRDTRALGGAQLAGIACARGAAAPVILIGREAPTPVPAGERLPPPLEAMRVAGRLAIRSSSDSTLAELRVPLLAEMLVIGGGAAPRPLGASSRVLVTEDGGILVVRGDSAIVQGFDASGRERVRFALRNRPVPPTRADLDAAVEDLLDRVPRGARSRLEPMLSGVPVPARAPAFVTAVVDDRGRLWVQRASRPRTEVDVHARDGRLLQTLRLPEELLLHDVTGAWAAFSGRDQDGIVDVRVHRVRESRP